MNEIHPVAAQGFEAGAEGYDRGRPEYAHEAVDFIVASLGRGRTLDLGAGTGVLTRQLVARGVDCVAVEPVAGMRARLAEKVPSAEILDGTAEDIPLPDDSLEAIVVAQAFHWFRHADALAEMARVLTPTGRFALVWNVRDEREAWVAALTEIIRPYEGADGVTIPRHGHRTWQEPLDASPDFRHVSRREFEHGHPMDVRGLLARVASTSFIAVLSDDERSAVLEQVEALTREPPLRGQERFEFPYVTEVDVYAAVSTSAPFTGS